MSLDKLQNQKELSNLAGIGIKKTTSGLLYKLFSNGRNVSLVVLLSIISPQIYANFINNKDSIYSQEIDNKNISSEQVLLVYKYLDKLGDGFSYEKGTGEISIDFNNVESYKLQFLLENGIITEKEISEKLDRILVNKGLSIYNTWNIYGDKDHLITAREYFEKQGYNIDNYSDIIKAHMFYRIGYISINENINIENNNNLSASPIVENPLHIYTKPYLELYKDLGFYFYAQNPNRDVFEYIKELRERHKKFLSDNIKLESESNDKKNKDKFNQIIYDFSGVDLKNNDLNLDSLSLGEINFLINNNLINESVLNKMINLDERTIAIGKKAFFQMKARYGDKNSKTISLDELAKNNQINIEDFNQQVVNKLFFEIGKLLKGYGFEIGKNGKLLYTNVDDGIIWMSIVEFQEKIKNLIFSLKTDYENIIDVSSFNFFLDEGGSIDRYKAYFDKKVGSSIDTTGVFEDNPCERQYFTNKEKNIIIKYINEHNPVVVEGNISDDSGINPFIFDFIVKHNIVDKIKLPNTVIEADENVLDEKITQDLKNNDSEISIAVTNFSGIVKNYVLYYNKKKGYNDLWVEYMVYLRFIKDTKLILSLNTNKPESEYELIYDNYKEGENSNDPIYEGRKNILADAKQLEIKKTVQTSVAEKYISKKPEFTTHPKPIIIENIVIPEDSSEIDIPVAFDDVPDTSKLVDAVPISIEPIPEKDTTNYRYSEVERDTIPVNPLNPGKASNLNIPIKPSYNLAYITLNPLPEKDTTNYDEIDTVRIIPPVVEEPSDSTSFVNVIISDQQQPDDENKYIETRGDELIEEISGLDSPLDKKIAEAFLKNTFSKAPLPRNRAIQKYVDIKTTYSKIEESIKNKTIDKKNVEIHNTEIGMSEIKLRIGNYRYSLLKDIDLEKKSTKYKINFIEIYGKKNSIMTMFANGQGLVTKVFNDDFYPEYETANTFDDYDFRLEEGKKGVERHNAQKYYDEAIIFLENQLGVKFGFDPKSYQVPETDEIIFHLPSNTLQKVLQTEQRQEEMLEINKKIKILKKELAEKEEKSKKMVVRINFEDIKQKVVNSNDDSGTVTSYTAFAEKYGGIENIYNVVYDKLTTKKIPLKFEKGNNYLKFEMNIANGINVFKFNDDNSFEITMFNSKSKTDNIKLVDRNGDGVIDTVVTTAGIYNHVNGGRFPDNIKNNIWKLFPNLKEEEINPTYLFDIGVSEVVTVFGM